MRETAVSPEIRVPCSTAFNEAAMRDVVLWDASALFAARFLISAAMTAKPLPFSPARAASTAALRDNIFVWKEISSIALIILLISLELCRMSCIADSISCMRRLLTSASFTTVVTLILAFEVLLTLDIICWEMSSMTAASSSAAAACSVAP